MSLDQIFQIGSTTALLAWLLLATASVMAAGQWQRRLLFIGGRVIPVLLSAVYVVLLIIHWKSAPGGGFGSLDTVATLFASRGKLLGGWLHFLAFDLLVGRWIIDQVIAPNSLEGRPKTGLSRWILLPCLPLTFMFGPAGFLLYQAMLLGSRRADATKTV